MQLYASKTKVTPINSKHSIARQLCTKHLCATQLASLLYDRVRLAVKLSSPATFWTDSMTVVHWLRASLNCWKPFVANRVSQVQHLTQGSVWWHIPGVENPADLASRGCLSKDLLDNPLWWQGPSWIYLPEDQWPESPVSSSCEAAVAEQRATTVACPVTEKPPHRIFTLHSSFSKLRRIVAYWVQYFSRRFKRLLCRLAQQDQFEQKIKALHHNKPIPSSSKLKWLHPQLEANGIICIGGRLSNAPLLEDTKHPILVPNNHPLAEMTEDPSDAAALTPGHFLVGSHLQQVPDAETTIVPENRLTHWRQIQQLKRHFWRIWHQEYLQQLQPRSKWVSEGQVIKPGTLDMAIGTRYGSPSEKRWKD
uniref:DUF5641 domain-containing protein n=1 Tax=Anopheles arabiensis TaxID=7173 RepID=A0A182HI99_ANOAR